MNKQLRHLQPKFNSVVLILLLALTTIAQTENETRILSPNQTIEREMTGAETHRYKFELQKGEFFQVRVEQKGVDVVVKLLDSNRKLLSQTDSLIRQNGREIISWISDEQGIFEIEICAFENSEKPEKYSVYRAESRNATDQDKKRVETEALFWKAMMLHRATDEAEQAKILPLLNAAHQGWKQLGDDYMSQVAERQRIFVEVIQNESLNQLDLSNYLKSTKDGLKAEADATVSAVMIFRKFQAKRYEANSLLRLGYINVLLGEVETGLKAFNKALDIQKSIGHKRGEAISNFVIGRTYYSLGENQKALEYLNKASAGFASVTDKAGEALITLNTGFVYEDLEDYKKALDSYYKASNLAYEAEDPITFTDASSAIASFMMGARKFQEAIKIYLENLEFRKKFGDKRGESTDLHQLAYIYFQINQKEKAIDYYLQSVLISNNTGDKEGEAKTFNNLMFTFESLNQIKAAILCGKLMVNNFQELRQNIQGLDKETQNTFLKSVEDTYRFLAKILIANGRIAEAEQVLDMLKEEEYFSYLRRDDKVAADLKLRIALSENEKKAFDDYEKFAGDITRAAEEFEVLKKKIPFGGTIESLGADERKRHAELELQYNAAVTVFNKFLEDLKVKFGKENAAVAKVESDTIGLLKKLNQPRTVIISTIVGEDRLNLIVTTSGIQKAHTVEIKAADLNKLVADFRETVKNPNLDPRPLGKQLYDKLFPAALQKDLENIKADTIVWSLDGTLRYVPMSALWDGEKYLVERYNQAVITLASRDKLESNPNSNRQNWVAFGVGVSKAFENFNSLPAVPKELCSVVKDSKKSEFCKTLGETGVFNGVMLKDEEFTFDIFKQNLGKTPIVHIASHFALNPGEYNQSYLLLGGGQNRKFSLVDVRNTRLDGIELLTLSACNTAMTSGNASNGLEVEGFGALAQNQGVKSVLATLWAVADDSTGKLMTDFYKIMETNPSTGKAEAMRQAQINLIKGKNKPEQFIETRRSETVRLGENADDVPAFVKDANAPFAHPYFWSPFILFGNWR